MSSTFSGFIDCPDCGRLCRIASGGLKKHQGKAPCLAAQATNKYRKKPSPRQLPLHLPLPSLLRQSNQLMRRVPKSARYAVAESLIEVLNGIGGSDRTAWESLLIFPYIAFSMPATKEKRTVSLATLVKRNLTRPADPLTARDKPKRPPTKATASKLQKAVMRKMNAGDVSGRFSCCHRRTQ